MGHRGQRGWKLSQPCGVSRLLKQLFSRLELLLPKLWPLARFALVFFPSPVNNIIYFAAIERLVDVNLATFKSRFVA